MSFYYKQRRLYSKRFCFYCKRCRFHHRIINWCFKTGAFIDNGSYELLILIESSVAMKRTSNAFIQSEHACQRNSWNENLLIEKLMEWKFTYWRNSSNENLPIGITHGIKFYSSKKVMEWKFYWRQRRKHRILISLTWVKNPRN